MDELVASAVAHWGPRFTVNGVTVGRLRAGHRRARAVGGLVRRLGRPGPEHEALGRDALAEGRTRSAGEHLAQAAVYHHFAKFVFVEDLDQMRAAHARAVACLDDALPHLDPPGRRVEIPFEGSPAGRRAPAAAPAPGPHPVVVLVPGLDSTKEELRSTEQTFLDRGLATFTVDGPGQGEAEYDLPIRGDWSPVAEAVWVDAAATLPELDRARLGVWGVSLGGYYAARVAAALGDRATRVRGPGRPVQLRRVLGRAAAADPRHLPGPLRCRRRRGGAADRADPRHGRTSADDLVAPLLIVFGRQDRLIPWQQADRLRAAVAGPVELLMLEDGNHGCANVAPWHRPRTADWLAARLAVGPEHDLTDSLRPPTKAGG